jgi:UDP-glucuronate 4-epimerase
MTSSSILVTGAAGFIGFHLAQRLAQALPDTRIVGLDNVNSYYDPSIKEGRLAILAELPNFTFIKMDLADQSGMADLFAREKFEYVIHLAAQAGVRYSLENPHAYINSNIVGFLNILEGCRHNPVKHLLYASSSSVYGANTKVPFSTDDRVDHPVSLYAATKKSNELMAHTYAHLYGVPSTGLRFFTVYGPWGRPDMAYFKFTQAIYGGKPIDVYNFGDMKRDFTYVDDIVEGIVRLMDKVPSSESAPPHSVYNIGNNQPEDLMDMISILESQIGIKAERNLLPMQPGDVYATFADVDDLTALTGFKPSTSLKDGLEKFIGWYKSYYKKNS